MASAEEIRQRVRTAEQERIDRRADLVAQIAEDTAEIDRRRAELAEMERIRAEHIVTAEQEMSRSDLAGFLAVRPADVTGWVESAPRRRRAKRRSSSTRTTSSAPQDGDAVGPAVSVPAAVSADADS